MLNWNYSFHKNSGTVPVMIDTAWSAALVLLSTLTNNRWCPIVALLDDMLAHLAKFVKKLSAHIIDTVVKSDLDPDPTFKFDGDQAFQSKVDLDPASQHDADLWGSMRIQILIRMWIRNASGDTMVLNLNMPQHKLATSQKREKQTKCGEKEILKMTTFTPLRIFTYIGSSPKYEYKLFERVLGIRDILVRIRIRFLSSLILRRKNDIFSYYFLITCPQAHHHQSKKLNFLQKFCLKMLFCRHCFSPLNTFMREGKDPEPDPDPYLWLMDTDPDPQHWFENIIHRHISPDQYTLLTIVLLFWVW